MGRIHGEEEVMSIKVSHIDLPTPVGYAFYSNYVKDFGFFRDIRKILITPLDDESAKLQVF